MSRQIAVTVDQIEKALKGSNLSKEEFLHRLVTIKTQKQELTYDELAEKYADEVELDSDTYRGDVVTAFVSGMMKRDELQQRKDLEFLKEMRDHLKNGRANYALQMIKDWIQELE